MAFFIILRLTLTWMLSTGPERKLAAFATA